MHSAVRLTAGEAVFATCHKMVPKRVEGIVEFRTACKGHHFGKEGETEPKAAEAPEIGVPDDVYESSIGDGRKPRRMTRPSKVTGFFGRCRGRRAKPCTGGEVRRGECGGRGRGRGRHLCPVWAGAWGRMVWAGIKAVTTCQHDLPIMSRIRNVAGTRWVN